MRNKKEILVLTLILFAITLMMGCAGLGEYISGSPRVTGTSPQTIYQAQTEPWSGPKARLAVMEFENKTGVYYEATRTGTTVQIVDPTAPPTGTLTVRDPIGHGMKEQLVTALSQTGAFILIERQAIKDILKEQELGASGRVQRETAPRIGELEAPDFLVYGAVTEYQPSQASVGVGGGTGALPIIGDPTIGPGNVFVQILARRALGGFLQQDHVAIDLRLVDARTGRIVSATSVEGRPRDLGAGLGGMFGDLLLGIGFQYQTPMQKAVRACSIKAANWVAESTLRGGVMRKPYEIAPAVGVMPAVGTPQKPEVSPKKSDSSAVIIQVQQKLTELGYNPGPADGIMGVRTRTALKQYQRNNGLAETGEINEATLSALGIK